jgi:c(7)-type cytochrome triheme protein
MLCRTRTQHALSIAAGVSLAAGLLAGCSTQARKKTLSVLFDGVTDTPRPPTQRVRRDLLKEIESLKQQAAQAKEEAAQAKIAAAAKSASPQADEKPRPLEAAKTWEEAAKLLPSTEDMPDWSKALREGLIAPKPGVEPQAPRQPVMSLDVEMVPEADATYKVVFSHDAHTPWLSCGNCHPGVFEMKRSANAITMDKINAGQQCGVCHGKVAFSADACTRCHRGLAEGQ